MATIETAEGQSLIVERPPNTSRLYIEARIGSESQQTKQKIEYSISELYADTALDMGDQPTSRRELTAAKMSQVVNLVIGKAVIDGIAERRADIDVQSVTVHERTRVKKAKRPLDPTYKDGWPGDDAAASEKVRWMLKEMPSFSDEEIAVVAGCSRSLVSDIKSR